VRARAAVAKVRDAAEVAVLDAGGLEFAGALGVLLVAGGAGAVAVGAVGGFEGRADGELGALEGFDCRGRISARLWRLAVSKERFRRAAMAWRSYWEVSLQ
jgi:hypothetical protein